MWKKPRLYDLKILQTDIWEKNSVKKKRRKTQKKKHRQNYLS